MNNIDGDESRDVISNATGNGGWSCGDIGSCPLDIIEKPTCEMLSPQRDKDESDRRKNMDGDAVMCWIERRLLTNFQEGYPGEKVVLILGDAPYHHGMGMFWRSPLQATKNGNLETLPAAITCTVCGMGFARIRCL